MNVREAQLRREMWFSRRRRWLALATRAFNTLDPIDRVHLDRFPYPHYAYGIYVACLQARMLGERSTTVIEFGVAGGNGLVAMENAAADIGNALDVSVEVLGFDTGEGMPPSMDARDVVYWFRPTAYRMDAPKLKRRLKKAHLFLGRLADTVVQATTQLQGPIGFCSFDVDYYTSTLDALRVFEAESTTRLPRVAIYADDIFGWHDLNIMGAEVGEEGAFAEFNSRHPRLRILPIRGLRYKRPIPAKWNDKMFALHDLTHPQYNTPINPDGPAESTESSRLRG